LAARVALFSDSHDRLDYLGRALEQARTEQATHLIHAGDLCAPFVIAELGKNFSGPIHIVFGNNDGDGRLCAQVASSFGHVTLHGPYFEGEIDGVRCAAIHYPEPALRIAQSGELDLVVYGHDHQAAEQRVGDCLLVNPGELMGRFGEPSWGLYDGKQKAYRRHHLG